MLPRLALVCATVCAIPVSTAAAQQSPEGLLLDLSGEWQFRTGDNLAWKAADAAPDGWSKIRVPSSWESRGHTNHDGYAWYRRVFKGPPAVGGGTALLHLGRIDDADEVYVNGAFVGATGGMPPAYYSAYDAIREYPIPPGVLDLSGENVITVRVYDRTGEGGIVEGPVGLSIEAQSQDDLLRLDGVWSFRTGDDPSWSEPELDKEGWTIITVPGNWEPQGFRDYDGYAWYRREFFLADQTEPTDYVLLLGRIDDLDATFVNGREVGRTGSIDRAQASGEDWQKQREYLVPAEALRFGEYNVISVRVFDATGGGGLYEGPHALYPAQMEESKLKQKLQDLLDRVTGS